jgi:cobalt-precorrin 5A hydrolase
MSTGKFAVIAVTLKGAEQAEFISKELGYDLFLSEKIGLDRGTIYSSLKECFVHLFENYDGIVAVMAQGIVTRMCAPLLDSKYTDPAVVVCDEVGRYAISAISGHEGGANKLAHFVASVTGAVPIITTATEANKTYIAGIGCRRGTSKDEIISALLKGCDLAGVKISQIRLIASAWVKSDEQGLIDAADELGIYLRFLPKHLYDHSPFDVEESAASRHIGIKAVAEPSALISGFNSSTILNKTAIGNVTVAIVKEMTKFK